MMSPNALLARAVIAASVASYTISGCVLPSPACAITEIISPASAAIFATPPTRSASLGSGTPTSSSSSEPLASTAGMASRRAATKASPSTGSSVEKHSVAPASLNTCAMNSASWAPAGPRSSEAATIMAAALRSRPIRSLSSTALMATASMNSSMDGRIFPVMVTTELVAASTESKVATTVAVVV